MKKRSLLALQDRTVPIWQSSCSTRAMKFTGLFAGQALSTQTALTTCTGTFMTPLLEAIRKTGIKTRFYQTSSSEMFGSAPLPQNESSPFQPRSPYAAAKVFSYHIVQNYRDAYNIFACNGILFNHESPRRGETFVTRKIVRAATQIKIGLKDKLYLGNLEAKRDWGFSEAWA